MRRQRAAGPSPLLMGLMLLTFTLVWPAPAAHAVASQRLDSPVAGTQIDGVFDVVAAVTPDPGEAIDFVEVRFSPTSPVIQLEPAERNDDGSQRWTARIDPLGPATPLRNGDRTMQVRTVPVDGPPTAFAGHPIRLAVMPPARSLNAAPMPGAPESVALTWERVDLPDFVAYRIERRPDADGGVWQAVLELDEAASTSGTDNVPAAGEYRYRLSVVRSSGIDGDGASELATTSPARGVRATPDDPGTFEPPAEGTGPPPDAGTPGDGPISRATDAAPGGQPDEPAQPAPAAQPGSSGQPPVAPLQPAGPQPSDVSPSGPTPTASAAAAPLPAAPDLFEEALPFETTEAEIVITETETAFIDGEVSRGGSLNVYTESGLDQSRDILTAAAGGLLLLVVGAHVRRYLAGGRR